MGCGLLYREVPQVDFATGLQQTIDWYRADPDWLEHIRSGEYRQWYERQYGERISQV